MKVADVRAAACGRWLEILPAVAPALGPACARVGRHVPCPVHGGRDGFRLFKDAADTGGGVCNSCGRFSDGIAVLQWATGRGFSEVLQDVEGIISGPGRQSVAIMQTDRPRPSGEKLEAWWREAQPDPGRIREYLRHRGLSGNAPDALRFHPRLPYYDEEGRHVGDFPAILARVETVQGHLVALHRTYLDPTGPGKAPLEAPKKLTPAIADGATAGAAIRLGPPGPALALTEGIETALAVMEATGLTAWATVSAGGLQQVELPPEVERPEIWADRDANGVGQEAARGAAARFKAEGRSVRLLLPPREGEDWLDVLAREGPIALAEASFDAEPWAEEVPTGKGPVRAEAAAIQADRQEGFAPVRGAGPYHVEDGCLAREKPTQHGVITEPLCNFAAQVTEELVLDDGVEPSRAFIIEGHLETGERLPAVRVPAARFAGMGWVTEHWGLRAVVRAGQATRDYLREAIQRLSPVTRERRIFTHTGWRGVDGAWVYLTASGAVGRDGFEVDLGPELPRYHLPRDPEDPVEAMRMSLRLLQLAPPRVTVPLWAAVYRAPLASACPVDGSLWVEGPTGSLKSTLAALFLAHYGDFDRTHLPGAWSSTANQLERRAFVLKDVLFVVDDYAPSAMDARELEAKAARLIRAQGNLAGRGRLRADLSDRPAFPPRGLIVSTGEQHPPGQSLLVRMVLVELELADVDLPALTEAQRSAPRLPHALAGYVAWLAPQLPTLPSLLRETFAGARARATADGEHLRVPEALAHLWLGLHSGLTYAEEIGACSRAEAEHLREEGWAALLALGRAQGRRVEEERPSRRFLTVLLTLVSQRRAVLLSKEDGGDGLRPGVDLLGWQDEEGLYLLPEAALQGVARFCREAGEPFPVRSERLKRDLAKEALTECDPGRHTRVVKIAGRPRRVLSIRRAAAETLLGEAFPLPVVTEVTGFGRERGDGV